MNIILLLKGQKFSIYGIVLNDGTCLISGFLEALQQDNIPAHKSLLNVLRMHAEIGPLRNTEKSREIEGHNDLYEFKSPQGARLPYFYLPGGITIITHGFKKGDPPEPEFKRADSIRKQYFKEHGNG